MESVGFQGLCEAEKGVCLAEEGFRRARQRRGKAAAAAARSPRSRWWTSGGVGRVIASMEKSVHHIAQYKRSP